jgi:hypothetical protein
MKSAKVHTDELLINSATAGRQLYPSIAASDAATLVVAWESRVTVDDANRTSVRARLFDANGTAVCNDIVVDDGLRDSRNPDVAANTLGRFVVTWVQEESTNTIMARLFDPNGLPTTEPFEVSVAGITSLTRPAIAMDSLGRFVIAWDGDPNRASEDDVYARLYDPNGAPLGEPFIVNTIRSGAQQWPQVAINDANEIIIVWTHETQDPNAATDIFARRFDDAGQPAGEQFQINDYTPDKQRYPDVALMGDGSFLAAWESNEQDGSGYGIFVEFVPPLLLDDLNNGI